jgi:transcriptional regulator with XRE-family HTH domain
VCDIIVNDSSQPRRDIQVAVKTPAKRRAPPARRPAPDGAKRAAAFHLSPLGNQIRDLREARGLSIARLAAAIDKSIGYVSQIERGRSEVSISTLKAISDALEVQIGWFFQGYDPRVPDEHGHVVRREHRRRLNFPGTGIEEELLSPTLTGEAELILSTFAPGARSGDEQVSRMAEQSGFVVSGELEVTVGKKRFRLRSGDSFCIGRGEPFGASNPGPESSVSLWVIAPPRY